MQEAIHMWDSYIKQLSGKSNIVLFSTATTGLKPGKDSLIAFSYCKINDNGEVKCDTLFNLTCQYDKLEQSMQYHQISADLLDSKGLYNDVFAEQVSKVMMDDAVCFSYRTAFQSGFLDDAIDYQSEKSYEYVFDLPLFAKAAASKMVFDNMEADTLVGLENDLMQIFKVAPSLKKICERFSISYDVPPSVLPVEHYASCLLKLWNKVMVTTEVDCQEDLFD